jgi:serine/threonine protein kinase
VLSSIQWCSAISGWPTSSVAPRSTKVGAHDQNARCTWGKSGKELTAFRNPGKYGNWGTLTYSAPEVLRGASYSYPADLYSLGVVLAEMVSTHTCIHISRSLSIFSMGTVYTGSCRVQRQPSPSVGFIIVTAPQVMGRQPYRSVVMEDPSLRVPLYQLCTTRPPHSPTHPPLLLSYAHLDSLFTAVFFPAFGAAFRGYSYGTSAIFASTVSRTVDRPYSGLMAATTIQTSYTTSGIAAAGFVDKYAEAFNFGCHVTWR